MADYSKLPSSAALKPTPFTAHASDAKLKAMFDLLRLSPIGPQVWENTSKDQGSTALNGPERRLGVRHDWLTKAKDQWLNDFDWRKHEEYFNTFPQYTIDITGSGGETINVHFMALFSERDDAVPIGWFHGWPGNFSEFLGIFQLLKDRYSPKDLPYHVVAPSLPGYAYSSGPPMDRGYDVEQATDVLHKLMVGLFPNGYLAQGGDIGSTVVRLMAAKYDECKGMHANAYFVGPPDDPEKAKQMDALEAAALARGKEFFSSGLAYAIEHGTRPGTIGLVLSSSPLALLAWIGEKMLEWTDEDPSIDHILRWITLYWLTDSFPRCIYPYRAIFGSGQPRQKSVYVSKPSGYTFMPKELSPVPLSWAGETANIVSYRQHEKGGHFAADEQPEALLADVEEWVPKAWPARGKL